MEIKTTLVKIGGSRYMRLPPLLLDHLGIEETTKILTVKDEEKKKGKFFSAWK